MSKLKWDQVGERIAETGVDQGVLYPFDTTTFGEGVPWNGLTSVNEAPTGGEPSPFYADNQKYLELMSEEEFAASIGCYTYPDEFKACVGETEMAPGVTIGQQTHKMFGFSYRTKIINDTNGMDHGFKIHLVYNALAGVTSRDHTTMNDSPELEEISYDITTTKVPVTGGKPTSHLVIDSTKFTVATQAKLQAIMDALYGKDAVVGTGTPAAPQFPAVKAKLLMPDEVMAIINTP